MSSNSADTSRPLKHPRAPWVIGGLIILGIALDAAHQQTLAALVLISAIVGFFLFLLNAWNNPSAFIGFWVWVHFEDLVRLVTENLAVFFVKVGLLAALFIGYYTGRQGRVGAPKNPIAIPLFLYTLMVFLQCFNPNITHPLLPLVGIHSKLLYILLMPIAMAYFDSKWKVRQYLAFLLMVLALESGVSLLQYFNDPMWWYKMLSLNAKAEVIGQRPFAMTDTLLKTGSIFNNPGRFGQLIIVCFIVCLGAFGLFYKTRLRLAFWAVCVAAIFVGGVLIPSGRAIFYVAVLSLAAIFLVHNRPAKARRYAIALLPFVILAGNWIILQTDPNIKEFFLESLSSSTQRGDSVGDRVQRGLHQLYSSVVNEGLTGHGTGTSSQGRQYIVSAAAFGGKENGYAALIWEFGVFGALLWLFLMGVMVRKAWNVYVAVRETEYSKLAFSFVVLLIAALILQYVGMQYLENYIVAMHFWTFMGLLFALPRLAKQPDESPPPTDAASPPQRHR